MSGLLPDLASWALRGQAAAPANNEDGENGATADGNNNGPVPPPLTPEEMRAQRLQRMQQQQEAVAARAAKAAAAASTDAEPMVTDSPPKPAAAVTAAPAKKAAAPAPSPPSKKKEDASPPKESKKKRKAEATKEETAKKLQRRKELLLRKVLSIVLTTSGDANTKNKDATTTTLANTNLVTLTMDDDTEISVESIAEILATRLSLTTSELPRNYANNPKSLIAYLGECHRKTNEELKTLRQSAAQQQQKSNTATNQDWMNTECMALLQEISNQVVSYAATILQEPDLFELGKNASMQLAKCLMNGGVADPTSSITFGISTGAFSSSFYSMLVEELLQQDATGQVLESTVHEICAFYTTQLSKCESILDVASGVDNMSDASPVVLVSALTSLCMHKRVAQIVATSTRQFLLPRPGTPEANQVVTPNTPSNRLLQQFMAGMNPSYKKRSGPALDKSTLLGLCLRIGVPKNNNNPAFSAATILRQSLSSVESATAQQRSQLLCHQQACNQLLHNLVKAGADSRNAVLQWFTDAMLVNVGATATRPDPSKVSCNSLLINVSVALLKLCDPFVNDESKHYLIDAGYVTSTAAHQGIFPLTGDDAIRPLGSQGDDDEAGGAASGSNSDAMDTYNPKNPFISSLFFLTTRSLNLGVASLLSQHENLLRHISHAHWMISSRNGDLQSDPHFAMYVSRQRSNEVALFEPDMVKDTLRFLNLLAKVLVNLNDEQLATMPEDFVRIICDVVMSIAKLKAKELRGLEFRDTFALVVKLLSPDYAKVRKVKESEPLYFVFTLLDAQSSNIMALFCIHSFSTNSTDGPQPSSSSHARRCLVRTLFTIRHGRPTRNPSVGLYRSHGRRSNFSALGQGGTRNLGAVPPTIVWGSGTHRTLRKDESSRQDFVLDSVSMGKC